MDEAAQSENSCTEIHDQRQWKWERDIKEERTDVKDNSKEGERGEDDPNESASRREETLYSPGKETSSHVNIVPGFVARERNIGSSAVPKRRLLKGKGVRGRGRGGGKKGMRKIRLKQQNRGVGKDQHHRLKKKRKEKGTGKE